LVITSLCVYDAVEVRPTMRIAFVVSSLRLSGGVRVIGEYANRLARRGHTVSIVTPGATVDEIVAGELDPQVTVLETVQSWSDTRYDLGKVLLSWQLARAVPDSDVVVATHTPTTVPAWLAGRILSKGRLAWLYLDYKEMFRGRWVEKRLLTLAPRRFDRILVASQACQEEILDLAGVESVKIGIGLSSLFCPRQVERDDDDRLVLFVGDTRPRKGLHDFLQAASLVYRKEPKLKLAIVSKDACHIQSEVPLTCYCRPSDEELAALYTSCDVFVSASWYEGFGLPPLEAMACGAPVVLTDSRGVREFAIDGENCLMVPIQDPDSLTDAILRVLTDNELATRIAANGLQMASRYSWDEAVDRFERALSDV
jgi:glycosyltransferase involved in cell wall biosynthesis